MYGAASGCVDLSDAVIAYATALAASTSKYARPYLAATRHTRPRAACSQLALSVTRFPASPPQTTAAAESTPPIDPAQGAAKHASLT